MLKIFFNRIADTRSTVENVRGVVFLKPVIVYLNSVECSLNQFRLGRKTNISVREDRPFKVRMRYLIAMIVFGKCKYRLICFLRRYNRERCKVFQNIFPQHNAFLINFKFRTSLYHKFHKPSYAAQCKCRVYVVGILGFVCRRVINIVSSAFVFNKEILPEICNFYTIRQRLSYKEVLIVSIVICPNERHHHGQRVCFLLKEVVICIVTPRSKTYREVNAALKCSPSRRAHASHIC